MDEVGEFFGNLVQRRIHVPDYPMLCKIWKERIKELDKNEKEEAVKMNSKGN